MMNAVSIGTNQPIDTPPSPPSLSNALSADIPKIRGGLFEASAVLLIIRLDSAEADGAFKTNSGTLYNPNRTEGGSK